MAIQTPSKAATTLGIIAFLLVGTTLLAQQLGALGDAQSNKVSVAVAEMIEAQHLLQKPIDDSTSEQLVKEFIKLLDPQKLYFLKEDVTRFEKYKYDLDDLVKAGNIEFGTKVYSVFQTRVKERVEKAHKLIDVDHDFSVDESIIRDAKDEPFAESVADLDERWRKRIKFEILLMKFEKKPAKSLPGAKKEEAPANPNAPFDMAEARTRLHRRYKMLQDNIRTTEGEEIAEYFLSSLCSTFDPHSSYMAPRTLRQFEIDMRLKLEGIGASLKSEDGYTTVNTLIPGGAAHKDGRLKVNDRIVGVANGNGDFVDTVEMRLTKVVDMIRGKAGTVVRLKVQTGESGEIVVYDITRAQVELKQQEVKGEIIDTSTRIPGTHARVGVIYIPTFYRDFQGAENNDANFASTARDVAREMRAFKSSGGVDAIIIDLRNNGGGALQEAIDVSGLFVNAGPIVQVKTQKGTTKTLLYEEKNGEVTTPVVVVTNRHSASASEIFAGAIKDYGRGIVVGDSRTHGKGTVQTVVPIGRSALPFGNRPELGSLKLTIQQFYRVNGMSTQRMGVPSDIVLPSFFDHQGQSEEDLDNAMPYDQINEAQHRFYRFTAKDVIASVAESSKKRVADEPEFQRLNSDIEKFLERKKKNSITLNEETLRKERLQEEQKVQDEVEKREEGNDIPVFADNPYNKELLAITLDYIAKLSEKKTVKR